MKNKSGFVFNVENIKLPMPYDGGDDNNDDKNKDDIEAIKKERDAFKQSIQKLESKRDELLGKVKSMQDNLKKFEGIDPDEVKKLLSKLNEDEDAQLLAKGEHEQFLKKKTEKLSVEFNAKLKQKDDEVNELKQSFEKANSKVSELLIDTSVIQEFVKVKGRESAIDDVKARARKVWKIENGEAIPRDLEGNIIQGKSGVLTQAEWIASLKTQAPHLFPDSTSPNANGNTGSDLKSPIDEKIAAARKAGDFDEVRRLRAEKKIKGKS